MNLRFSTFSLLGALVGLGALAPGALAQCEVQKLTASDADLNDEFGFSVAVDGATALVGARVDDGIELSSGSAYVYDLTASGWMETAKLVAGDPDLGDTFGEAVAISGDTALVTATGDDEAGSAAGAAYIFERTPQGWVQTQKLFASDAGAGVSWGNSADLSGNRAIIGARLADAAYVLERTGGIWLEVAKLTASDGASFDWFGVSVSISGDTAIVGAYQDDDACVADPNCNSGSAYIFERTPGGWVETAKLTASDGAAADNFGFSVAISAGRAVVGSPNDGDAGSFSGSAYVFERSPSGSWGPNETQKIIAGDAASLDHDGGAVAISSDVVLVAAHNDDNMGSAYVFQRRPSGWVETGKLTASDRAFADLFGFAVALCEETILVGAWGDDDACPSDPGCNSGSAYVFTIQGPLGQNYCGPAVPNSAGQPAAIHACGSKRVADNDLVLRATHLPPDQFGYFLGSLTRGFIPSPPGSQGNLCLGGQIGRFAKSIRNSGPSGTFGLFVDLTNMPPPLQSSVQPGETWNLQAWFRDKNPGPTSNFTDGVAITFR